MVGLLFCVSTGLVVTFWAMQAIKTYPLIGTLLGLIGNFLVNMGLLSMARDDLRFLIS